jgi:uncharacterized membrane protein
MRLLIYGMVGCCFEIIFTGIKHMLHSGGKDWSFTAKSYIWMLPIYGLAVFLFEPLHNAIREFAWPLRGLIYVGGIYIVEFGTGWILRKLTGRCPWDYSTRSRYHYHGLIRWDYAPIWFLFSFGLELLHDLLLRIRIT